MMRGVRGVRIESVSYPRSTLERASVSSEGLHRGGWLGGEAGGFGIQGRLNIGGSRVREEGSIQERVPN